MKTSFLIVKWDTFEKVWINFLILNDLAYTGLLESEVQGDGWNHFWEHMLGGRVFGTLG